MNWVVELQVTAGPGTEGKVSGGRGVVYVRPLGEDEGIEVLALVM